MKKTIFTGAGVAIVTPMNADGSNENVELSSRNIPKVTALSNGCLNCFDLLHNNKVFLAKDAVAKIEEVLA